MKGALVVLGVVVLGAIIAGSYLFGVKNDLVPAERYSGEVGSS